VRGKKQTIKDKSYWRKLVARKDTKFMSLLALNLELAYEFAPTSDEQLLALDEVIYQL